MYRSYFDGCKFCVQVFGLEAVKAVIMWKWNTWAKRFLLIELACYLLWLLSFNAFTLLFQVSEHPRLKVMFCGRLIGQTESKAVLHVASSSAFQLLSENDTSERAFNHQIRVLVEELSRTWFDKGS